MKGWWWWPERGVDITTNNDKVGRCLDITSDKVNSVVTLYHHHHYTCRLFYLFFVTDLQIVVVWFGNSFMIRVGSESKLSV